MTKEDIAKVCHEVNRLYCLAMDDTSQKKWDEADEWQRESALAGVVFRLENPDAPISIQHDDWMAVKKLDGWTYGPVKNPEKKEHPCMVPYDQLPVEEKAKDFIFVGIVNCLKDFLT